MNNDVDLHFIQDGSFNSSQKPAHIYYKHFLPKNGNLSKVKYHFIFQHGAFEYHQRHHEFYDSLRESLGDELVISCMDLVGHGQSGGARSYISHFDNFKKDYSTFLKICRDLGDFDQRILGGHSLGGLIVLSNMISPLEDHPFIIDKLVLINPSIQPWFQVPSFAKSWLFELTNKMAKIRLPAFYDGFEITRDFKRAADFNNDQLNNHFMTMKLGYELIKEAHHIAGMPYYLETPTLFLTSGKDTIVNSEVTQLFMHGMEKSHVSQEHYEDSYHDLLNETCRTEVFNRIIDYIKN